MNRCSECSKELIIKKDREECTDMCENCYKDFIDRVEKMNNRDYRMQVSEAAVFWANRLYHSNQLEANYRAFFACVMPEKPQHEVETFIKKNT